MEYIRPPNPGKIALLISLVLFFGWLTSRRKKWNPQLICLLLFLGVMWLDVTFAVNTYSAFWTSYRQSVFVFAICLPLPLFVDTVRRLSILINSLIVIFLVLAIWAITHAGFGPSGARGGQDQNYVSLSMSVALPFAYFLALSTKRFALRVIYTATVCAYIAATVVGFSRGGFVGLAVVLFACLAQSPRKWRSFLAMAVLAGGLAVLAPADYWAEVESIGDTSESTADMRLELWKIAVSEFQSYPLTGVGPGNYTWNIGEHQSAEQDEKFHRSLAGGIIVHSLYFEILAELGLAGVLLFGAMLFYNYAYLRRAIRESLALQRILQTAGIGRSSPAAGTLHSDLQRMHYIARGLLVSFLGFLACSVFLSTTYFSTVWVLTAITVALAEVMKDQARAVQHLVNDSGASVSHSRERRSRG